LNAIVIDTSGEEFFSCSGGNFYVAFFAPGSVTRFTDLSAATETFGAFDGYDAAAVADVAFNNSFLGGELPRSFAFIAFSGDGTRALAFTAIDLACTVTSGAYQNRKPQSDLSGQ
jgi:hypothetical protein